MLAVCKRATFGCDLHSVWLQTLPTSIISRWPERSVQVDEVLVSEVRHVIESFVANTASMFTVIQRLIVACQCLLAFHAQVNDSC